MSHPAQQIRFCTSRDGTRIAYAVCGSGPPLVRAPHWLTHLDLDWESPVWGPWLSLLASRHTLIRFDHRGCGLSDRDEVAVSFDKFVDDFEAVVDAARLERFAVFGWAGGASTAIGYAARHPQRVSRLVAFGSNVVGRIARATTPELRQEAETQLGAIELGWSNDNPAYRQLFTTLALPDGTVEQFRSFNDQIRQTAPPANASRIMRTYWTLDLAATAAQVRCPALVFHAREDGRIPFEQGRALASLMPNATFVPLESRNHLIMPTEPAWRHFATALDAFLAEEQPNGVPIGALDELTPREREVLELVAQGLDNSRIAVRLKIRNKTTRNHVSNIFSKLGVNTRAQAVAVARDAGLGRRVPVA